MSACSATSRVSSCGLRSASSIPSSRITSTTSGWTRSAGVVPAESAVWRPFAVRSNSASLTCERPALCRHTNKIVLIELRHQGRLELASDRVHVVRRELLGGNSRADRHDREERRAQQLGEQAADRCWRGHGPCLPVNVLARPASESLNIDRHHFNRYLYI